MEHIDMESNRIAHNSHTHTYIKNTGRIQWFPMLIFFGDFVVVDVVAGEDKEKQWLRSDDDDDDVDNGKDKDNQQCKHTQDYFFRALIWCRWKPFLYVYSIDDGLCLCCWAMFNINLSSENRATIYSIHSVYLSPNIQNKEIQIFSRALIRCVKWR